MWHLLPLFSLPPFLPCCNLPPAPTPVCLQENNSRVNEQFSWTETNDFPPSQGQVILEKAFPLFKLYMCCFYLDGRSLRGAQGEPCGLASLLCGSLTRSAQHLLPEVSWGSVDLAIWSFPLICNGSSGNAWGGLAWKGREWALRGERGR